MRLNLKVCNLAARDKAPKRLRNLRFQIPSLSLQSLPAERSASLSPQELPEAVFELPKAVFAPAAKIWGGFKQERVLEIQVKFKAARVARSIYMLVRLRKN